MDFTRLTQGEKIAGASGIALILIMFIFDWFGLEFTGGAEAFAGSVEGSRNAWGSYGFIDIVLFITVAAAIGLALISASQTEVGLPVAASAVVAGLGILSVVLIVYQHHQPAGLRCRPVGHRRRTHSEDRRLAGADRGRSASPTAAGARCRRREPPSARRRTASAAGRGPGRGPAASVVVSAAVVPSAGQAP